MQLPPAFAQNAQNTPTEALARLFRSGPAQESWFDPAFLAHVSVAQIDGIVAQYTGQFGSFQHADASGEGGGSYTVFLERGSLPAKAVLNAQGQFAGLWFGVATPLQAAGLAELSKEIGQLPGHASLLVLTDGQARAELNADAPLAVGSTFKLAILSALQRQIVAGRHRWDEVVRLDPAWKSLSSGVLQNWPSRTPLTLATLANEMISISDNTAADALLAVAGRKNVEALAMRDQPFLSTREAFILKDPKNRDHLAHYRLADAAGKAGLLPELDKLPLPNAADFGSAPAATDVEWFFSTRELCALIESVRDLPAFEINPGLAKRVQWKQIAFKGGSEGGVLNLTTALTGHDGRRYCVSATWNDSAALDEQKFFALYNGVLAPVAKGNGQ